MKFRVADSADLRFYPVAIRTEPGTYEVRGTVYDVAAPVYTWDALKFAGFWYDIKDNLKSEVLTIENGTGTIAGTDRTIDENKLNYTTTLVVKKYKVYDAKGKFVENGLEADGSVSANKSEGKYYAVVGWQAEKFIALKGKANKLVKQILEQSGTDKKTLQVGETWDLGDGYTLTAQSIDAKATPRQAWLVLSKDGNKLDDKVISQGEVYTYSANVASVTDVPVFVTYVDSVFAGATSDMVQLKYTWVISQSVTEIKGGDKYGNMEVDQASDKFVTLKNVGKNIDLTRDSTVDIMGNMKFRVADSADLRFYPMVEYVIGVGPTTTATTTGGTATATATGTATATATGTATPPPAETTAVTTAATPAPTATQKEPGFEAVFAITGLLAVAFLVLRQRK